MAPRSRYRGFDTRTCEHASFSFFRALLLVLILWQGTTVAAEMQTLRLLQGGLSLVSPRGGEDTSYFVGDTLDIVFTVDSGLNIVGILISLSTDDGKNYHRIAEMTTYAVGRNAYRWEIGPTILDEFEFVEISTLSDSCRIRIEDYNAKSFTFDESELAFRISRKLGIRRNYSAVWAPEKLRSSLTEYRLFTIGGRCIAVKPGGGLPGMCYLIRQYSINGGNESWQRTTAFGAPNPQTRRTRCKPD